MPRLIVVQHIAQPSTIDCLPAFRAEDEVLGLVLKIGCRARNGV
ncbi:hypothetical protein [Sphingobium agri]|nr:hypothetical protein [Sphingobium agri]